MTIHFPWGDGLKVEEIEAHYNKMEFPKGKRFRDWEHGRDRHARAQGAAS